MSLKNEGTFIVTNGNFCRIAHRAVVFLLTISTVERVIKISCMHKNKWAKPLSAEVMGLQYG